jgi:MscS family membrane protein
MKKLGFLRVLLSVKMVNYLFSILLIFYCTLAFFPFLSPARTFAAPPPASVSGPVTKPAEPQAVSEDPLGRNTPYGTVTGFIRAMEGEEYQRASNYLEGKQSAKKKEELARLLKVVLDRGMKVSMDALSRKPEGNLADTLFPNLEILGVAKYGDESLDILLHRVDQKGAPAIWLFSSETLLGIADAAEQLEPTLGEKIWPRAFKEIRFLSVPLFMWINDLLLIPLVLGFAWLLTRGLFSVLRPLFLRRIKELSGSEVARFHGPIFFLILSLLLRILAPIAATISARTFLTIFTTVLIIMALIWFLVRLTNLVSGLRVLRLRQATLLSRIALTELSAWLVKGLWVVAGVFLIVRSFGIDVTAALAGLGVGGIAIAFAAQKTIENLFGTVTVVTDQPIRIGDFCQAGNVSGTVESIGLRSTRIRTLDRTLVTIPNGQLATMSIENFAYRDKFLFRHNIRLRHETTVEQLRHVLAEIRRMMTEHPKVESSTIRIRFIRIGDSSLDLEVFAYVSAREIEVFLEIQEDLLLRIMDLIEASGTRVALPSQTTYVTRDPGRVAQKKGI